MSKQPETWEQQALQVFTEGTGWAVEQTTGGVQLYRPEEPRVVFHIQQGWSGYYVPGGRPYAPNTLRAQGKLQGHYTGERVVTFKRLKTGGFNWPAIRAKASQWFVEGAGRLMHAERARAAAERGRALEGQLRAALGEVPRGVDLTARADRVGLSVTLDFTITAQDDLAAVAAHVQRILALKPQGVFRADQ